MSLIFIFLKLLNKIKLLNYEGFFFGKIYKIKDIFDKLNFSNLFSLFICGFLIFLIRLILISLNF